MTQVVAPPCERCGAVNPPNALVCLRCGTLTHRAELEHISREAMSLEAFDPAGAAMRWRRCLELLPPDSQQYAAIYNRLAALAAGQLTPTRAVPPADTVGSALLKTGGSMLISILVYAGLFYGGGSPVLALKFATGFVLLILIHELGHVAAMRYYGLSAGPPIFIPFMGALINLRQPPQNAKVEAVVGIGGPIAGTIGALACYGLYVALGPNANEDTRRMVYALAHFGFILNLFNLLPVPPLDGGRITAAVNPKVWMLGIAGLIAMAVNDFLQSGQIPILLLLVLFFALPRVKATLRRRNVDDPYYAIGRGAVWTIGVMYVALGLLLLVMRWLTADAFERFM
jgi:Zn-dependent protease